MKYQEKLKQFVEAELKAGMDRDLLEKLHVLMDQETMYWSQGPERRNALNAFFREIHNLLDAELLDGKYGASVVIDSTIVMVFEVGYRLGLEEGGYRLAADARARLDRE